MSPITRKPAPAVPVAQDEDFVAFGDLTQYQGGGSFDLPEGDYAVIHHVLHHRYTKKDGSQGQEMIGVMADFYPLTDEAGEVQHQFMSLGKKAYGSFVPDETGKKLKKVPGSQGSLNGMTNFNLYLDSLYQSGLDQGIFTNDVSVLDGIWVHAKSQPAPEQRKQLGAATGEVAQTQRQGPDMIAVVTEIKDDGKPWENGGGLPDWATAEEVPAPKPAVKTMAKPAAKPPVAAPKPAVGKKAAPAPVPEGDGDDDTIKAAISVAGAVLEANPDGLPKVRFKTSAFASAKSTFGDDAAQAIMNIMNDEDGLAQVLGEHGYVVAGAKIAVAPGA